MRQRWRAWWMEGEKQCALLFDSLNSLMIARIDCQLACARAFLAAKRPDHYALEEVQYAKAYDTPGI